MFIWTFEGVVGAVILSIIVLIIIFIGLGVLYSDVKRKIIKLFKRNK